MLWRRVPLAIAALLSTCRAAPMGLAEFFGQDLWSSLWERPDDIPTRVQMLVLDLDRPFEEDALTADDRLQACYVGVAQLETQWQMKREMAKMRQRLRSPSMHGFEVVTMQWTNMLDTTCADLDRRAMVEECQRVVQMDEALEVLARRGKTAQQMCAYVQEQATSPEPLSCKLCKRFVQMIVQALTKDMEQVQQVREILGDICDEMAADSKCHDFLKQYDDIVEWLKEGTDPAYICPRIYMCPTTQNNSGGLLKDMDDKTCWFCDEVTTVVEVFIQEQPDKVDMVREYADMICQMIGNNTLCQKYDKQLDYVVDSLKQGKKPREICKDLKYCTAATQAIAGPKELAVVHPKQTLAVAFPDEQSFHSCFYCVHVTAVVRFVLKTHPKLLDSVRDFIEKACKWTPKGCKCDDYVKDFDQIVSLLKQGKEPVAVCRSISMCKKKVGDHSADLLDLLSSDHVAEEVAALVIRSESFDPAPDRKCLNCHYFATLIEIVVQERPALVDEIRQYGDLICSLLGDDSPCHTYMQQLDFVVDALQKGEKPPAICVDLKYCSKTKAIASAPESFSRLDLKESELESAVTHAVQVDDCFFCTQLGRLLKIAMEQEPDQINQIRRIADLVCKTLPKENKCHAIVHNMDVLIDSIRKGEDPGAICQDLHYCTKRTSDGEIVPLSPTRAIASTKCAYCDGVLTVLKYALHEKPDEMGELREAAGIVCELLPQDDTCHTDLKMYDQAVQELNSGKSPHVVCQDLKFCNASEAPSYLLGKLPLRSTDVSKEVATTPAEASMSVGCLLCEYVAELLKHIHLDPKQQALAKQALETMCTVLPPTARCDVLTAHFDTLATLMHEGKSPSQACNQVGLCSAEWAEDDFERSYQQEKPEVGNVLEVQ